MNRLQKFIEQGPYGEKSGRIAYAFSLNLLPDPHKGFRWQNASDFSAADELLKDEALKDVFKAALDVGYAVLKTKANE